MVINMKKNSYNDVLSNITNTINAPVDLKKGKSDMGIYTFYLTFVVLVISQFLFLDRFTYFQEIVTLKNGLTLNTFTVALLAGIVTLCLVTLLLKPHIVNRILFIVSFITITLFVLNYVLLRFSLNDILFKMN